MSLYGIRLACILIIGLVLSACMPTAGIRLALTTPQVTKSMGEGLSALPYHEYADTSIEDFNQALIESGAPITLEDTYRYAYQLKWEDIRPDAPSKQSFLDMQYPTFYFQRVLKAYGVPEWDRYILTNITTSWKSGLYLVAVVYRPMDRIEVTDKLDGQTIRTYSVSNRNFYQPFQIDIHGQPLDRVIDWAVIPREYPKKQKHQAILFTLAANLVLAESSQPNYWAAEQRWLAGDAMAVTEEQDQRVAGAMGLESGFIDYQKEIDEIEDKILGGGNPNR